MLLASVAAKKREKRDRTDTSTSCHHNPRKNADTHTPPRMYPVWLTSLELQEALHLVYRAAEPPLRDHPRRYLLRLNRDDIGGARRLKSMLIPSPHVTDM